MKQKDNLAGKSLDDLDSLLRRSLVEGERGRHEAVVRILNRGAERFPDSAVLVGLLGRAYFELERAQSAAEWFARAVRLSPKSELASLGLFQSLWDLGNLEAAFGELRRYLSVAESKEYDRLLHELALEGRLQPITSKALAV